MLRLKQASDGRVVFKNSLCLDESTEVHIQEQSTILVFKVNRKYWYLYGATAKQKVLNLQTSIHLNVIEICAISSV